MFDNIAELSQIHLDPAFIFIIVGAVIFIIGFCGCVGALRENTVFLLVVSLFYQVLPLVYGILFSENKTWYYININVSVDSLFRQLFKTLCLAFKINFQPFATYFKNYFQHALHSSV